MDYVLELRKLVGHRPLLIVGVCIAVLNEQDEILFIERTDNDLFGFPAGSLELGETVEEGAKREIYEETGLTAGKLEFVEVYSGKEQTYTYPNGDECFFVTLLYVCRDYKGELVQTTNETRAAKFYPANSIPQKNCTSC